MTMQSNNKIGWRCLYAEFSHDQNFNRLTQTSYGIPEVFAAGLIPGVGLSPLLLLMSSPCATAFIVISSSPAGYSADNRESGSQDINNRKEYLLQRDEN
jgi:hypothetical protein